MTDSLYGYDSMDDMFQHVATWVRPRVNKEIAPLGLAVGPFTYEFVDLNNGEHRKQSAHMLRCAKVSFSRRDDDGIRGNVLELDPLALKLKAEDARVPLPNLMVKYVGHEEVHIAHNQDVPMAESRVILDGDFVRTRDELDEVLEVIGDDIASVPPELALRRQILFRKTLKLNDAIRTQSYLREGLAVSTENKVDFDGTFGRVVDEDPRYVHGPEVVATVFTHPKLGPGVVRTLFETTGATVDDMFTQYEAEYDLDRWSRRVRRVGFPMGLPDKTFERQFAAKYERHPARAIGRLLAEHVQRGAALTVAQAGDSDQLPRPLADLVWDIGHVAAEIDGTNPRQVLVTAQKAFRLRDADARIGEIKKIVSLGATVAAGRARLAHKAGDPMPVTVANLSRSASALMEVERDPRPSLRRAASRALFGR